jgi:hypothetical protein
MKPDGPVVIWGYAVEALFAGVVYGCMILLIGSDRLVVVMSAHWQVVSTIAGMLFAAGLAAIFYLDRVLDSEFGKYLHWRKADLHYLRAYQIQTVLFLIAAGLPIAAILQNHELVAHLAWCIFLYACINGLTVVQNIVGLVRLRQKFRSEHDAVVSETRGEQD